MRLRRAGSRARFPQFGRLRTRVLAQACAPLRYIAQLGERFRGGELDFQPLFVLVFFAPMRPISGRV